MRSIDTLIEELKKAKKALSSAEPHKDDPEHEKKEKEKALKIKKEAQAILDMHKSDEANLEKAKVDEGASPAEKVKIRRARKEVARDSMAAAEREVASKVPMKDLHLRKPKSGEKADRVIAGKHIVLATGSSKDGIEAREALKPKKKWSLFKEEMDSNGEPMSMEKNTNQSGQQPTNETSGQVMEKFSIAQNGQWTLEKSVIPFKKPEEAKKPEAGEKPAMQGGVSPEQQKANKAKSRAERNAAAMREAKIQPKKTTKQPEARPTSDDPDHLTPAPSHLTVIKSSRESLEKMARARDPRDGKVDRSLGQEVVGKPRFPHGTKIQLISSEGQHGYTAHVHKPGAETHEVHTLTRQDIDEMTPHSKTKFRLEHKNAKDTNYYSEGVVHHHGHKDEAGAIPHPIGMSLRPSGEALKPGERRGPRGQKKKQDQ